MGKKSEAVWAATTHDFESWEETELKRRRKLEKEASRIIALRQLERVIEFESSEEIELKRKKRKIEREASRAALDRLERSVEFEDNLQAEKEIRSLCRSSIYYVLDRNPLNRLGLFLKRDYSNDIDEEVVLCGDCTTDKPPSFHRDAQINGGDDGTLSVPLSPKQAARVSMLKSRFVDVISKSQKQLGLLDRCNGYLKKDTTGRFKRNYLSQNCKTKPTIKAPVGGASTVA